MEFALYSLSTENKFFFQISSPVISLPSILVNLKSYIAPTIVTEVFSVPLTKLSPSYSHLKVTLQIISFL